jgi:AP-3 complex subunit beta
LISNLPQDAAVRLQTITLAAKLLVLAPADHILGLLGQYVFSMARYDLDYDVRDRARTLSALLANVSPYLKDQNTMEQERIVLRKEQVQLVLFHGKADVVEIDQETGMMHPRTGLGAHVTNSPSEDEQDELGSFAAISSKNVAVILPDWLEHGVDPSLRDSPEDQPPPAPAIPVTMAQRSLSSSKVGTPVALTPTEGSSPAGSTSRLKDLDKFYDEGDNEESDTDSDTANKQGEQESVEEFEDSEQGSEDEST